MSSLLTIELLIFILYEGTVCSFTEFAALQFISAFAILTVRTITGTVTKLSSVLLIIVMQRRVYPDGTSKTVWNDGRQETCYASGRVRRRDARGELVLDAEFAPGVPLPCWPAASAVAVSSAASSQIATAVLQRSPCCK